MPQITALREYIQSGQQTFPVFIGFMRAADILAVSSVPFFSATTSNQTIATNVLTPPIREWQRPMDKGRVHGIAQLFDDTGEMMPNPVLLAENVAGNAPKINVTAQTAPGGVPTNALTVDIPIPNGNLEKPLWVLDGQHRINGLAASAQKNNYIPVVFLLNLGGNFYSGPLLAKIFAQVTTTATKLDDLHNEWLTFAFKLNTYAPSNPRSQGHQSSMEAVADLCKTPIYSNVNNVFCNHIKFNHFQPATPAPGGFSYSCKEFSDLIYTHYYNMPCTAPSGYLTPSKLAEQISLAHHALTQVVSAPLDRSVFFGHTGINGPGQKIMQDAFLAGIMQYLLSYGVPQNWTGELKALSFDTTNWDFSSWTLSLNGVNQTVSRDLALATLKSSFQQRALPIANSTIADILRGNNASVTLEFSTMTTANRPSSLNRTKITLTAGNRTSFSISPRLYIKVSSTSVNVGKLEIVDANSPPGRLVHYNLKKGLQLSTTSHVNPLKLFVTMMHYGGNSSNAQIDINW